MELELLAAPESKLTLPVSNCVNILKNILEGGLKDFYLSENKDITKRGLEVENYLISNINLYLNGACLVNLSARNRYDHRDFLLYEQQFEVKSIAESSYMWPVKIDNLQNYGNILYRQIGNQALFLAIAEFIDLYRFYQLHPECCYYCKAGQGCKYGGYHKYSYDILYVDIERFKNFMRNNNETIMG